MISKNKTDSQNSDKTSLCLNILDNIMFKIGIFVNFGAILNGIVIMV